MDVASTFSPSLSVLVTFLAVSFTLNVTPGTDMMFVVAHTLDGGAAAGRRAALGIATGSLSQMLLAIAGIAQLIAASGELLRALALAGAGYLIWIGVGLVRRPPAFDAERDHRGGTRPFARGIVTNLLNIKVVLFYVVLLPLFVRDGAGPEWQQVLVFGLLFNALGTAVLLCVASTVDLAAYRFLRRRQTLVAFSRAAGAILILLAATVALHPLP